MNMKLYILCFLSMGFIIISHFVQSQEQEFVLKKKSKKESVAMIKEDIGQSLENCLRQMNKNIMQLARVQEDIFNKIKDLVDGSVDQKTSFNGSIEKLKEQREKLQNFHLQLVEQEYALQSFLTCF